MRTHVFIVNDVTFPRHLQYLFAGTGAADKDEHITLLSDIKRVRPGDSVIFYIEASTKVKGGFYGIFKISDKEPFVFHTPRQHGLQPDLKKKLIYRTLIEPYEVYSEGVSEWEALDKLPVYATDLQWSLIYRKLKGQRGCTPLLPWESTRLADMIRNKNNGTPIADSHFTGGFDWDAMNRRILSTPLRIQYPFPRAIDYSVIGAIHRLQLRRRAYEVQLQLYFTENIGVDRSLDSIVGDNLIWFGNEVASGVGMQKIDILTLCQDGERKEYRLIEFKDEAVQPGIVDQLNYYVQWASQDAGRHLEGAFSWNLQPVVMAPSRSPRNWREVTRAFEQFNRREISLPVLYFELSVHNGDSISLERVEY